MAITPTGMIRLLNVPLDKAQQHQIRFASRAAQSAYFTSKTVKLYSNVTHSRKDNMIKVPEHIDRLWNVNYVMYNNVDAGSRWFYSFIDRMEYIGENSTAVYLKTDVYQTWMQDCTWKPSFVVREHVADDTIGLHTVPEGLETGEYIRVSATKWSELDNLVICMMVTEAKAGGAWDTVAGHRANGVYSAIGILTFTSITDLNNLIDIYITDLKSEAIVAIFMAPQAMLPSGWSNGSGLPDSTLSPIVSKTVTINNTTISGYTPKNNKLFCHPYNMLHATNMQGQSCDYHLELFHGGTVTFTAKAAIGPGMKVVCYPSHYAHYNDVIGGNVEFALTLPPYPICGWLTDVWKQYIAQNASGLLVSGASAGISIAAGALTGQPLGIAGGIMSAGSQVAEVLQKMVAPPHVNGNVNNSNALISAGLNHFEFYQVQIREEAARIIDEFFSMYGYKVNRVKVPEQSSRPGWNFIQTSGANIQGAVPQDDLVELKNIFDKGVTLWHNGANVGDYTGSNAIEVEE